MQLKNINKREILRLANTRCEHGMSLLEHPNCLAEHIPTEKVGFLDIETSNLHADFGYMISYCIKELDGKIYHAQVTKNDLHKGIIDRRIMMQFVKDAKKFDRLITFYGKRFDMPFLRTRAVFWKMDFPVYTEIYHTDVYDIIKRKFRLHSNRLQCAAENFDIPCKQHRLNPNVWQKAQMGNKEAIDYILEHNKEDVITLEELWKRINFCFHETKSSI